LKIVLALGFVAYPLLIYLLIDRTAPALLVGMLGALAIARLLLIPRLTLIFLAAGLLAILGFCALAYAGRDFELLKLYPVIINLGLAAFAVYTLIHPPSAIERIARRMGFAIDSNRAVYTRGLTKVWIGFFCFNGGMAAYTTFAASTGLWALYNGLLSYILIAILFGAEYLYRGWYARHIGE
jgi:uncharacterized membrane protein